jgi:Asp-tRNA(Asn)/Glu-tRNA(Gln) amidotransferase A subunit family amidase
MTIDLNQTDAFATAIAVWGGQISATAVVQAVLERIAERDPHLNCFTEVMADQALARAALVDEAIVTGKDVGPLAGVPFAVKNLFNIAGLTTLVR